MNIYPAVNNFYFHGIKMRYRICILIYVRKCKGLLSDKVLKGIAPSLEKLPGIVAFAT